MFFKKDLLQKRESFAHKQIYLAGAKFGSAIFREKVKKGLGEKLIKEFVGFVI
jgi:hypothetical protein